MNDFKANGYESLISRKFMNQNRRKVTYDIERLLLSIDAQPEQPFNTTVWEQYNLFVQGELELYDPETGEVLNPADFTDKDGNPLVLSPATVANYLNNPKNKALRAKLHMSQWDFNNAYRPYHLRSIGGFSLSKVSLDDRDLPRPMKDGNRVKAYYAYDVVSGACGGICLQPVQDYRVIFRLHAKHVPDPGPERHVYPRRVRSGTPPGKRLCRRIDASRYRLPPDPLV